MKFGDSHIGQAVFFEIYDDEENEITALGYIRSLHSQEDGVIMVRVNTHSSHDAIVNLNRLSPAKGVF